MRPRDLTIVAHDVGGVGGMERVLAKLVEGLARDGHRVRVIARSCRLDENRGVEFVRVRGPRRPFLLAYPWFLLAGSLKLRQHRRGVVQVTGAIVLNRADVISVHYLHKVGPTAPSSDRWAFRAHSRLAAALKRFGERACYRRNRRARFLCVSAGLAAELAEQFPQLRSQLLTVHNGVDLDAFRPPADELEVQRLRSAHSLPQRRLLALLAARGEWERKGLEPLLRALPEAGAWDLAVLGGDDQASYRHLAKRLGVAERVHWLGLRDDVQDVFRMADAFVLPSSYESFSLVTFEAAASALPILATAVSGVRELLEDGVNGFLITRDSVEIAARLRELSASPALAAEMGRRARASALAYGWERTIAGHRAAYTSL